MRVLGIETSGPRGSVALVEQGQVVAMGDHHVANGHAEQLLPLLERALAEAAWPASSLDRVAVGVGPGSFTGLRVGIALGQGLALGFDRPCVGVGSLHALAAAGRAPDDAPEAVVVAVTDARRDELFVAAHDAAGEVLAPLTVPFGDGGAAFVERVVALIGRPTAVWVGDVLSRLLGGTAMGGAAPAPGGSVHLGPAGWWRQEVSGPDAGWVARLGAGAVPAAAPPEPRYVREADALLPRLPPSPFGRVV